MSKSGKGKAKENAANALLGAPSITLKQKDAKGKLVDKTFDLIPYDDLPRQTRRLIRNAVIKAAPDGSSALDKSDIFLAAYDIGVIALRAAGAEIDPNDEALSPAVADELDQTISVVGLRVIRDMQSGGDSKNAEEPMTEGAEASA